MMLQSLLWAVALSMTLSGLASAARIDGKNIKGYPNLDADAAITIEGEIEVGDYDAFAKLIGDIEGQKGVPVYLELNSKGGSFDEAMKIARLMLDRKLSTRLVADAECLSACSIIFMAGTRLTTIGSTLERRMHRTAKLGFHAPMLSVPGGTGDASEAYDEAIEGIGSKLLALARFRGRQWEGPLMKPDLVNEMMLHHGRNFYFIDTVGKAVIYGIVIDEAAGPNISAQAFGHVCQNYLGLHASKEVADLVFEGRSGDWGVEERSGPNGKRVVVPMSRGQCTIEGGLSGPLGGGVYVSEVNGEDGTLYYTEPWAFWPGEKKLSTLPPGPSEKELHAQLLASVNVVANQEPEPKPPAPVVPPFVPEVGVSWNYPSRAEGERRALAACPGSCRIALWVVRTCGAIAMAKGGGWGTGWHGNKQQARKTALAGCRQHSGNEECEIKKLFCSPGGYGAIAVQNPP